MATDPLTSFSSSVFPFGLLLLLFREGENEFARLAILRPGLQVAMDSYDKFRVRTSHGTAPQLPTIQRISNQALSRIQCAPIIPYGFQETIPRGSSFPKGRSGWHPAQQRRLPHRTFSLKLIWSLKTLFCSVCAENQSKLHCHTPGTSMSFSRRSRILLSWSAVFFFFSDTHTWLATTR